MTVHFVVEKILRKGTCLIPMVWALSVASESIGKGSKLWCRFWFRAERECGEQPHHKGSNLIATHVTTGPFANWHSCDGRARCPETTTLLRLLDGWHKDPVRGNQKRCEEEGTPTCWCFPVQNMYGTFRKLAPLSRRALALLCTG